MPFLLSHIFIGWVENGYLFGFVQLVPIIINVKRSGCKSSTLIV